MEIYLTIEELANYLKLAEQTIRRWVLTQKVPFHKIRKVIRFRVSEIEKWIDNGGAYEKTEENEAIEGCLAVGVEDAESVEYGRDMENEKNGGEV